MKYAKPCVWGACIVVCTINLLSTALAGDSAALTLRQAIELTARHNPDIAAFTSQQAEVAAQVAQHALRPATTFDVQLENFAGSDEVAAARSMETTLQLSHVVEFGDKARLRMASGAAAIARMDVQQAVRRADIFAEVARRFVHVLADQEHIKATARATQLAGQARDVVQERIRVGAVSTVFLSRAEIALERAHIAEEHAEHELASSRVALAVMWGDAMPAFTALGGDLFTFPDIESLDAYTQRLAANPDLLQFASDARVLETRLRLAESQRTPNLTLTAGIRRLEQYDAQALVAGFSIPIGAARRAQPEIRSVIAERESLTYSEQAKRLELQATLFALYQEIMHARTEAQSLHNVIRPQAERVLRTSDEGYRAGRFSLLELTDAQQQLLDIEQDSIRAATEFHVNLIEIERVTGAAVHTLQAGGK